MMYKILEFFSDNKDALTAIGIILTFLASIISLYFSVRNNKAVHYVNSVTKSRIEWIDKLRVLSVDFCNACDLNGYKEILCKNQTPNIENIDNIKKSSMQIKLMLNYSDELDAKIIKVMDKLEKLTSIFYDIFECINHYLDEDGHIDYDRYSIQNLYDKEIYVQDFIERFCKWKNIQIDELSFYNRQSVIKECIKKIKLDDILWKELNINFVADSDSVLRDIEYNIRLFTKYIQIYLKAEWNRVKYESQGKTYEKATQIFDVWELEQKYDNPNYKNNVWKRFCINTKAKIRRIYKSSGFSIFILSVALAVLTLVVISYF